jgi:AraC-like DNA-binding protein
MSPPSASVQWFQGMLPALEAQGVNVARLLTLAGIDTQGLHSTDARIAHMQIARFWSLACEVTADPLLALRASRDFRPGCMSEVGYLMMSADTLAQALDVLVRYQRLLSDVSDCHFALDPDGAGTLSMGLVPQTYDIPQALTDMLLGVAMAFSRWLLGPQFRPRALCLRRPKPEDVRLYEEIFACPLRFGCAQDSLLLHARDLHRPLPSANAQVFLTHRRQLEEQLQRQQHHCIALQVGDVLQRLLPEGEPSRERVASLLNLSPSTLHRRLLAEGTSFKALLDQTRAALAKSYLIQSERTLLDIAFQLGFADPSNFFRSFKRWYGVPPGQYRKHAS